MTINLSDIAAGSGGFVINGECAFDYSGFSVASAGDVNGDGLIDLIVGAPDSDPAAAANAGRSYVVFGRSDTTAIDLSAVAGGSGGFAINGQSAHDLSGRAVAAAGDINGDGLADLLIGAHGSDPAGLPYAGRSYVVFGKATTAAINLSAVTSGNGGFVINGQWMEEQSGHSVAAAGDVNGDGLADVIVGAYAGAPGIHSYAGRSYVVFGQTGAAAVNLSAVAGGSGGFVINGQCTSDFSGRSVSAAGDINGDGLADLIVGADGGDTATSSGAGRTYVVFGRTAGTAINLAAVAAGSGGFAINGQGSADRSGFSTSGAGDVNGDGLADLIIGAFNSDPGARTDAGRSYVVFGRTSTAVIDLSAVATGSGGFVINGQSADDNSGFSVSGAGDVNGDGLADLIVGARFGDGPAGNWSGRSYLVFGRTATTGIDLSAVADGRGGFVINGQCVSDRSGQSVAAGGDVDGDGLADLIVGAYRGGPAAGSSAGRSYIIFGDTTGSFAQTAVDQMGTTGNDTLTGTTAAETLVAGAGNDTLIGNGGADVLYGGAGNDTFTINAGNIAALGGGVTNGNYARVDGGSGVDTLAIVGAGVTVNLGLIANQGGASPSSASRIESIERIDLTGSGNNTLILSAKDVIDMAGMNSFNNANGWTDGTYNLAEGGANGANPEQRHQLVVDRDVGDTLTLSDAASWTDTGTVTQGSNAYRVFNHNTVAAQVLDVLKVNHAPTGGITITGAVTLGQTLTANSTLADADGLGAILYTWQASRDGTDWTTVGTGTTLALTNVLIGQQLRILADYTDQQGFAESVTSQASDLIVGSEQADTATGGAGNDTLDGRGGNDVINGMAGNDQLLGGSGNDTLMGGAGNDMLNGQQGSDRMEGGAGDDSYTINRGDGAGTAITANEDTVVELAAAGTDTVVSAVYTYTLDAHVENLVLQSGNLARKGFGNAADNLITGNGLNNLMNGEAGNDTLGGGGGNDTVNGGIGNDRLDGGLGKDVMSGGAGNDTFVFSTALNATTNSDRITDFSTGFDTIVLSNSIFTTLGAVGSLNPDFFHAGTSAHDADDHIIFNALTGALYYDPDGWDEFAQVQFATLAGAATLAATDIVVGV